MASHLKNLSEFDAAQLPDASGMRIGIVVADWNAQITHALFEACLQTLLQQGVAEQNIHSLQVPGAYELPIAAQHLAEQYQPDAIIALGCVIKGETSHNEYINHAVSQGLMQLSLQYRKPFIFGLLTTNNLQQAKDRAGGKHGNKGTEAAITALKMMETLKKK